MYFYINTILHKVLIIKTKISIRSNFKVLYHALCDSKLFNYVISDPVFLKYSKLWVDKKLPDVKSPKTFNEKLLWYMINYRKPIMNKLADKYRAREYIVSLGLEYILNDLIAVYDTTQEINFDKLPNQFVFKVNHGSGMNIICKEKSELDRLQTTKLLDKWLRFKYHRRYREWCYKDIQPKIICEKYLENKELEELLDYKFYCFSGKPEIVWVCQGRYKNEGVRYNTYDMDWNYIKLFKGKPGCSVELTKPSNFDEMVDIAKKLCKGFPFIRIDLYSVENKIFFGEFTFYPDKGHIDFNPDKYNYILGDLFKVPN